MKRILTILTLLLVPLKVAGNAYYNMGLFVPHICGPIKFVQAVPGIVGGNINPASSTSQSLTETAGNLLVVSVYGGREVVAASPNMVITVTDTLGNTYYPGPFVANFQTAEASTYIQMFYAANVLGGANNVTASVTQSGQAAPWVGMFVTEYSGAATTNVADIASAQIAPSSTANVVPGSVTTLNNCDLVVGAYADTNEGGVTPTLAAGWAFDNGDPYSAAAQQNNVKVGASKGAVINPSFTEPAASDGWVAVQMAFRASNTTALAQPTKLAFSTTPPSVNTWTCSGAMTIQSQDASSQPTITSTGINVGLSASNVTFYADSKCAFPISNSWIAAGTSSTTVYFTSSAVGSPIVTASASGLTSITQTETIPAISNFTWIGGAGCTTWGTGSCWQGGVAPGALNIAIFDGTCVTNCSPSMGSTTTVGGLYLLSGYGGAVSEGTRNFTVGANGFHVAAGTFNSSTSTAKTMTVNGPFEITGEAFNQNVADMTILSYNQSGGTFTGTTNASQATAINGAFVLSGGSFTAPSGTLLLIDDWTVSGAPTFVAPAGSLLYLRKFGFQTVKPGSVTYANVELDPSSGMDFAAGTMTVSGNLILGPALGGGGTPINNGTINVAGDVDATTGGATGTATLVLTGNAAGQTIASSGHGIPNLTINTGANSVTLTGNIEMSCKLTVTSVGTFNAAASTLTWDRGSCDYAATTISPGTVTYGNIALTGYSSPVDLTGSTWNIGGTLSIGDSNNPVGVNNGTISVVGDINLYNSGNFGSANIKAISSAAGQTIFGNGGMIPNLEIAAGTNTVTLNGTIYPGVYRFTSAGTFNTAGSTLAWQRGSNSIDIGGGSVIDIYPGTVTYANVYLNPYDSDVSLHGANWNVSGTLNLGVGRSYFHSINSGSINAGGDVHVIDNGFDGGTASIVLTGNASGQTIYGNGYNIPNITIAAAANPVTLNGTIGSYGSFTMTSVGTFTTTGSTLEIIGDFFTTTYVVPGAVTYNNVNFNEGAFEVGSSNFDLSGGTMIIGGALTLGAWSFGNVINNGALQVSKGLSNLHDGLAGTATISFVGTSAQTVSSSSSLPTGNVVVASTGGGSVTLSTSVQWNGAGQALTLNSGSLLMSGHTLNVGGTLTIGTGTTLTKGGGTLTYGSLVNNGTLNP